LLQRSKGYHRSCRGDAKKCLTHLDGGITCQKSARRS
jgi:hypothetical protein